MIQRDPVQRITSEGVKNKMGDLADLLSNRNSTIKKRKTIAPPAKQQRYDLRDLTSSGISNDRRNPDYHPWLNSASKTHTIPEVTVNVVRERGESGWKLNDFDSQQCSCDSNNNHGVL